MHACTDWAYSLYGVRNKRHKRHSVTGPFGRPAMIPTHLADATTHNNIGRRAKVRTCKTCGAVTLVGLDADRCAGEAHVDLRPLTALGEALALLAGRSTYRLRVIGRLSLDHRTRWHITSTPAGRGDFDVLADHVCHSEPLPTITSANRPPIEEETNYAVIPY